MGNVLPPVSGTIIVVIDATEEETLQIKRSGPRYPRPHLQRLESESEKKLAEGTLPPDYEHDFEDFEDAVTAVNTPIPTTSQG